MKVLKNVGFMVLILLLTNCTYIYGDKGIIKNRDTDYLKARSVPPLKIPPGLSSDLINAHYPVSYRDYPESSKKPSLIPPDL